ncbi:MAG TPA: carboxypeptidase-like regulatory domain-containing protein [Kofleriaceae bacterium]
MTRITSLALALGLAVGAIASSPAQAQIAAALGKPLPSPDLPVGTVTVRIVAGSAAAPIVGTTVVLSVNGTPREARTDSAGRASFAGLPPGGKVVAKVLDEDKKEHASEEFDVPDAGGTRVMITTKEWQGGAGGGGAPFAGGAAGMPEPRKLSGEPRPEASDGPGAITVRLTYNDLADAHPPEGIAVALVGYGADDSTSYQVQTSGKDGRVQFTGLDRSGGTSYFAMTLLPRDGAVDRLMSMPVILDSQVGVRLILSGEKRDSKAPAVDELTRAEPQVDLAAGKVRVVLEGVADLTADVSLIDAQSKKSLGQTKPQPSGPDPSRVRGGAQFTADAKLPPGTLDVEVGGGAGQAVEPMKDVEVKIMPASGKAGDGLTSLTGTDGTVRMSIAAPGPQKAVFTINGKQLTSQPFDLGKSGGKLTIRAQWDEAGRPAAAFDVTPTPGQVVYAEATFRGTRFRSLPFPLLAAAGSKITIYAFPRVLLQFQLQATVEDELLAVQGRFTVQNYSWAPYRGGPDGLIIPLPATFKGGVVFDPDQNEVSVAAGEGFRIVRPIPPGGKTFHGGFSLGVEAGKVHWGLDLPLGLYESQFVVKMFPGMVVHAPQSAPGEQRTVPQGTFFVIDPISIVPKQRMELSIEGMPARPAWRAVVPAIVGIFVVAIMLGGVAFALFKKPAPISAAATAARRQKLLDELVALERDGGSPERREQLLEELENLWA